MKKKILITGGSGFIGQSIIKYFLKNTDYDIVSIDRSRSKNSNQRVKTFQHDLKNSIDYTLARSIGNVDYILHLASNSDVDNSILNPVGCISDNVLGTSNILEFARLRCKNLKLFMYFSTHEVFGAAPLNVRYKEEDAYNPCNPYSGSKAAAEQICMSYKSFYNVPTIIVRPINVYGPGQSKKKFIPLAIDKIINNNKVQIHSNSELTEASKRFYLHSEDVASAVYFLIENHNVGDKYNIAPQQETDNLDLIKKISKILEKPLRYELVDPKLTNPRHDFRYALCGEKMKNMGWEQKISLEEGLENTIRWFLNNKNGNRFDF